VEVSRPGGDATAPCRLVRGDNAQALACLRPELGGKVTLAYLDPPFFTGRVHERVERRRDEESGVYERRARAAFDDRWEDLGEYLAELELRLRLVFELLAPEGCLVLHVDPKTSHYAKVLCDGLFGIECFASEVIWRYRRWPSKSANFQRVHDVMLRYVKDPAARPRFHQLYEPLAPSTRATWGENKQRAVTDELGRRRRSSTTSEPSAGVPLGDVWDIGIVAPVAKERTGYPTQKPEKLLARWIESCTEPGDLVLDPYMGSGTTLKVALERGRRAVGLDASAEAHEVASARLTAAGLPFSVEELVPAVARARSAPSDGVGEGGRARAGAAGAAGRRSVDPIGARAAR
jgi:site-specific DNA-methyltransferase (adenine-specific)